LINFILTLPKKSKEQGEMREQGEQGKQGEQKLIVNLIFGVSDKSD
jgi:hypothetical protein